MNTNHPNQPFDPDEQALLDFGDRIANGSERLPETDLEATVVRVNNTLRTDTTASAAMPGKLKAQIWENIMTTIPMPEQAASANPWTQAEASAKRTTRRTQSHPPGSVPRTLTAWSRAASIALALVLLLAGFGAFRAFEGELPFGGHGSIPTEQTGGQFAYAPVVATPAATAVPSAFACSFTEDIPMFPGVSQSPVDSTSLYLTPTNETANEITETLMLHCPEEPEDIELAQNVIGASPGPWQGIVSLSVLPEGSTDPADQYPSFLNVQTNQQVAFGTGDNQRFWVQTEQGSPWIVGPSVNDLNETQMVDLRTMEMRQLDELSGIPTPDKKMAMLSSPADNGAVALGYSGNHYDLRLSRDIGAPGDLLILGESFDDSHWITLDASMPVISVVKLSPDASQAALKLNTGSDTNAYAVVSAGDGSEIVRSGTLPERTDPFLTWVQDGSAIAYAGPSSLEILPAQPDAQPKTVLALDQDIASVRTTPDSNVLVAMTRADHGSDTDLDSTDVDKVYAVNLVTGDTHEFDGMELGATMPPIPTTSALLMFEYTDTPTISIRIYDPASGELVQQIDDLPNPVSPTARMSMGKNSYAVSHDGRTEAFAIGAQHIIVIQTQEGTSAIRKIEPPRKLAGIASIAVSPAGTTLSMVNTNDEARTRWMLDLSDSEAKWREIPNEGVGNGPGIIQFMGGSLP